MQQWLLKLTLSFGKPSIEFMGTQAKSLTSRPWVKIAKANNQSSSDIQTLYTVLSPFKKVKYSLLTTTKNGSNRVSGNDLLLHDFFFL